MRTKLFTLAALLLTPLAAICGGAEATLPAKPDASSKKTQNFLFIGNSFTMARDILRANYYSRRTEEVYLGWMRRNNPFSTVSSIRGICGNRQWPSFFPI